MSVTIVAKNPETLDGLQAYLRDAGVGVHGTRFIEQAFELASSSGAIVIFPDDFDRATVVSMLTKLRAAKPTLLQLVVTRDPRGFEHLRAASELLVVAKPAWGWTILDAIRTRLAREPEGERPR
jgi:hypothetical protein